MKGIIGRFKAIIMVSCSKLLGIAEQRRPKPPRLRRLMSLDPEDLRVLKAF